MSTRNRLLIVFVVSALLAMGLPVEQVFIPASRHDPNRSITARTAHAVVPCTDPVSVVGSTPGVTRISTSTAGTEGNAASNVPTISSNGRYVAFHSTASNLIGGDGDFAVKFVGPDARMRPPDSSISGSTTESVEAWFKTTDSGPVISMANSAFTNTPTAWDDVVYVGTDGKLRGNFWTGTISTITTTGTVNDGKWHHVVLTGAVSTQSMFLDGTLVGTRAGTINHNGENANYIGFGYRNQWPSLGTGWGSFNGTIDDVAFFRTALSSTRILAHFQARSTFATSYKSAVLNDLPWAYWRLNGATASDSSGNGRTGTYGGSTVSFNQFGALTVDRNDENDVFVRDRTAGTTERVSVSSAGVEGNSWSQTPTISGDGNIVAFVSNATNLVANDTNGRADLFMRDRAAGTTTRVMGYGGAQPDNDAWRPSISADGRYVAFETRATNFLPAGQDTNGKMDTYVLDRTTVTTTRASVSSTGAQGNPAFDLITMPSISDDGSVVAFASGATELEATKTTTVADVFVRETATSKTKRISVTPSGTQGNADSYHPGISGDGRFVAFYTGATNLVAEATSGTHALAADRRAGTLSHVATAGTDTSSVGPRLSSDGRYIAFRSSASDLVSGDTNGATDAFLKDQSSGEISRVSLTNGNAQATSGSFAPTIAGDGRYAAFESFASNLVSGDGNSSYDDFVRDRGLGGLLRATTLDPAPKAQSDELGLERFAPYRSLNLGTAREYVQLHSGNNVVQQASVNIPGEGLNVVVRHTYNSGRYDEDTGVGRGWTLSVGDLDAGIEGLEGDVTGVDINRGVLVDPIGSTVNGVFQATGMELEFVDGDGTTHRFVRSGGPCSRWDGPPGVNLRVREEADPITGIVRAYNLIRPDGVTYRAEPDTLLGLVPTRTWRVTSVIDRNGNQLTYAYGLEGLLQQTRITSVAHNRTGAQTIARFDYVGGELDQIVTLPGYSAPDPATGDNTSWQRTTDFVVNSATKRLDSVNDDAGGDDARTTAFGYFNSDGRLANVTDPRLHAGGWFYGSGRVVSTIDRKGKSTLYGYGASGSDTITTATIPVDLQAQPSVTTTTTYRSSVRAPLPDGRMAGGNIREITAGFGSPTPISSSYDWTANRLTGSTDGAGVDTSFEYNDLGLLTKITRPAPNASNNPLTPAAEITDPVVSTLEYAYPSAYTLDSSSCPDPGNGGPVSSEGWCSAVADLVRTTTADNVPAERRITDFDHDTAGNVTRATQRLNPDPAQPPSDPPGGSDRSTVFTYYTCGGLRSSDGPRADVSDVTTYGDTADANCGGYDRTGQPTSVTDARGKQATFAYTPYGPMAKTTDRDGRITASTYDARDNRLTVTDPADHTTSVTYDGNDNRLRVTSPSGRNYVEWGLDADDQVTSVTTPGATATDDPRILNRTYFDDGTLKSADNARGEPTTYTYWDNRLLKSELAPAGGTDSAVTDHYYDTAGREVRRVLPVTNAASDRPEVGNTFNPNGSVSKTETTSDSGDEDRIAMFAFDAHGELIHTDGPRVVGDIKEQTDTLYDVFGRVTARSQKLDASRTIHRHSAYDLAGNLTAQTQPTGSGDELSTTYTYDILNRPVAQTDPSNPGHTVTYAYSDGGLQLNRTDSVDGSPVRTSTVSYNPDRTIASIVATQGPATESTCNYLAGQDPSTGYDPDGHLLAARSVLGADCGAATYSRLQTLEYDDRGWLKKDDQYVTPPGGGDPIHRTQTFAHEIDGHLSSAAHDGRTTTFDYEPAGWLKELTDWRGKTTTATYFPSGAPATRSVGSGVASGSFDWAPDGMPSSLTWRKGTVGEVVRQHTSIDYDVGGLRTSEDVRELQPGSTSLVGGVGSFDYDLLGRLDGYTSPFTDDSANDQLHTTYELDDGGNITTETTAKAAPPGDLWSSIDSAYTNGRLDARDVNEPDYLTDHLDGYAYDGLGEETSQTIDPSGSSPERVTQTTDFGAQGRTAAVLDPSRSDNDVTYVYDGANRLSTRSEPNASRNQLDDDGGAQSGVNAADSVDNSITGDLDLRVAVAFASWPPPTSEASLVSKAGPDDLAFRFLVDHQGNLVLGWQDPNETSPSGAAVAIQDSLTKPILLRATLDVDDGTPQHQAVVRFYSKAFDPMRVAADLDASENWKELASQTVDGPTSIEDTSDDLTIAKDANGGAAVWGTLYGAEVRDGIDGDVVANPDFTNPTEWPDGATQATDASSTHWVTQGTASIIDAQQSAGDRPTEGLFFYWGTSNVVAEHTDGSGQTVALYVPSPEGRDVAQLTYKLRDGERDTSDAMGAWRWLLADINGNAATQLADDGSVVEQAAWDPYGRPVSAGSSVTSNADKGSLFGFEGAPTDGTTGSLMLGPRQYDPKTARFTQPDQFGFAGVDLAMGTDPLTGNRYLFAGANPVAFYENGYFSLSRLVSGAWGVAKQFIASPAFIPTVVVAGVAIAGCATGVLCPLAAAVTAGAIGRLVQYQVGPGPHTLSGGLRAVAEGGVVGAEIYVSGEILNVAVGKLLRPVISRFAGGAADEVGGGARSLFHYTTKEGQAGILESESLNPSLKSLNPSDARYGNGQYLSDIAPGTYSNSSLSSRFIRNPYQGARFSQYVEIDVTGLDVVQGRPGVFVVPNEEPLDLLGRILSWGANE